MITNSDPPWLARYDMHIPKEEEDFNKLVSEYLKKKKISGEKVNK